MENKPSALGKGLSAIFDEKKIDISFAEEIAKKNSTVLNVSEIRVNPSQPREDFDEEKLNELSDSIRQNGLIQPVTVKKTENGYILISGERRLRAIKLLGLEKIPVYFMDSSDKSNEDMLELALIENLQREDLNPMELSDSYFKLIELHNLTQEKIADKVSKNRSTVANYLRLQRLPIEIKLSLRKNEITEAHARLLLRVDNEDDQITLWKRIVNENITVKNLQEITKQDVKKPKAKKPKLGEIYDPYFQSVEDKLRKFLGTKVSVKRKSKYSGEIIIEYFSNDDLERIIEKCSD
ncbi:MAG: ParB/RepB/Spo0J family partition protein [Ignavibacteria bacterium]